MYPQPSFPTVRALALNEWMGGWMDGRTDGPMDTVGDPPLTAPLATFPSPLSSTDVYIWNFS